MARGTQFSQLVFMLRAEVRRSTNAAVGVDDLPDLKQAINRNYIIQRNRREWSFLNYRFNLPMATGQQYYDLPVLTTPSQGGGFTTPPPPPAPPTVPVLRLSHNHIKRVALYFSGVPQLLERGISFEDYALFDYEQSGAMSDPVLKWDVRAGTAQRPQIEVWPVPSSNTSYIKFFGGIELPALVNDSDACWLDDMLVVLYAAADLLSLDMSEPRIGLPPAAQLKLKQAEDYYNSLVDNDMTGRTTIAIGQGRPARGVDTNSLVRVRG